MSLARGWWAAFVLAPAVVFGAEAEVRADNLVPSAPSAGSFVGPLPHGIHRTHHGRYVHDMCDQSPTRKSRMFCLSEILLPETWTPDMPIPSHERPMAGGHGGGGGGGGGGGAEGMSPTDLTTAYNLPTSATAGGKIVAIIDSPDSQAYSDLTTYRSNYGLPSLPQCSGLPDGSTPCFAQVGESGSASTGQDSGSSADGETSLDMDMISAVCNDCAILLVEVGDSSGNIESSDILTGVQTAAKLGASATSISLGGPESGGDSTGYTTSGHLVLAASGDNGYDLENWPGQGGGTSPSYPASSTDVLAVGGTELFNNSGTYDEAVWNDGQGQDATTSGCSTEFKTPSWQTTALSGSGCSMRATADVSAAANFASGSQEEAIASYSGQWEPVEGTSASSPIMAGILVRLGLSDTISNNLGWVYTNAAAFNDLGSTAYPVDSNGSNTDQQQSASCGSLCTAGPGWDGPSGVGTPDGVKLLAAGGGTLPSGGDDAGASGGTDASTSGGGDDSGSGSTPVQSSGGDDSGASAPAGGEDAGITTASSGTGGFETSGGSSAGCGCAVPGKGPSPEGTGLAFLALGAVALGGSRTRKRK